MGRTCAFREDLNDPHAAALWDSGLVVRLACRKDLKDPHAAALWDSRASGLERVLVEKT